MSAEWYELVEEYKGCKVEYAYEEDGGFDPRGNDNLSHIWCWHRRYNLGDQDKDKPNDGNFSSWEEMEAEIHRIKDVVWMRRIRMYDHSGIALSLSAEGYPFNCPWDSGWVGYIFLTKDRIRENYMVKRISKKVLDRAVTCALAEFDEYDGYVRGEVYGYRVVVTDGSEDDGDVIDSCWGFIGDAGKQAMIDDAKAYIDWYRKTHLVQLPLPLEVTA